MSNNEQLIYQIPCRQYAHVKNGPVPTCQECKGFEHLACICQEKTA